MSSGDGGDAGTDTKRRRLAAVEDASTAAKPAGAGSDNYYAALLEADASEAAAGAADTVTSVVPGEKRKKMSKKKKKKKKKDRQAELNKLIYGADAVPSVELIRASGGGKGKSGGGGGDGSSNGYRGYVTLHDLRDLLLWPINESMSPGWLFVKNKPLIQKVFVLRVHCADQVVPGDAQTILTSVRGRRNYVADGIMERLLMRSAKKQKGRAAKSAQDALALVESTHKAIDAAKASAAAATTTPSAEQSGGDMREAYAMTEDQLVKNQYPPHHEDDSGVAYVNYVGIAGPTEDGDDDGDGGIAAPLVRIADETAVSTAPSVHTGAVMAAATGVARMYGVDCEMCVTASGYQLARVSIVDEQHAVVMDEYVVPEQPVTDYVFKYSGITAEHMSSATTTLADVQRRVRELIVGGGGAGALLVGHSLENDLRAMRIVYDRVIDTAILYPHSAVRRKNSLKYLTHKHLKLAIQGAEHDSVEDARAALRLVQLKIAKGPLYGVPHVHCELESLFGVFERLNRRCVSICSSDDVYTNNFYGEKTSVIVANAHNIEAHTAQQLKSPAVHFLVASLHFETVNQYVAAWSKFRAAAAVPTLAVVLCAPSNDIVSPSYAELGKAAVTILS